MGEEKEVELTATYDKDSRKYHRFLIDEGQNIVGTLYVPKKQDDIPDKVVISLKTKGEKG